MNTDNRLVVGRNRKKFVVETLLAVPPREVKPFFYRTNADTAIDLVVEHDDGTLWASEVKCSLQPASNVDSTSPAWTLRKLG